MLQLHRYTRVRQQLVVDVDADGRVFIEIDRSNEGPPATFYLTRRQLRDLANLLRWLHTHHKSESS